MKFSESTPGYRAESALVSMDETRKRFAVLLTERDARWANVPDMAGKRTVTREGVKQVINRAEVRRLQLAARAR
jgi:hypothetical protein